eukprot:2439132-Rhodomonas_salina.1
MLQRKDAQIAADEDSPGCTSPGIAAAIPVATWMRAFAAFGMTTVGHEARGEGCRWVLLAPAHCRSAVAT